MNEAAVNKKLIELAETINGLNKAAQGQLNPADGVYHSDTAVAEPALEESLDRLRLQIKYLVFDLEATRRENRYLRQMLETRPRPDMEGPRGGEPEKPF